MSRKWWRIVGITLGVLTLVMLSLGFIRNPTVQVVGSVLGVAWAILLGVALVAGYVQVAQAVGRAAARKGRSETAWFLIAFFFGIFIPAIIVAAMAPTLSPMYMSPPPTAPVTGRKCPFCAEEIQVEAIKCKHCGEMLSV